MAGLWRRVANTLNFTSGVTLPSRDRADEFRKYYGELSATAQAKVTKAGEKLRGASCYSNHHNTRDNRPAVRADEAISFFVDASLARNRYEASRLLRSLVHSNLLHHLKDENDGSTDDSELYRFRADDQVFDYPNVYDAAAVGKHAKSWLVRRIVSAAGAASRVGARESARFFLLPRSGDTLLAYDSDIGTKPVHSYVIGGETVAESIVEYGENVGGCTVVRHTIVSKEAASKTPRASASASAASATPNTTTTTTTISEYLCVSELVADMWIQAFVNSGATYRESPTSADQAASLFEFTAARIVTKEPVHLSALKEKVCLVVNVATY